MRDSLAHILYIGKAKNLKKRVSSYFLNKVRPPKLNALLSLVSQIDYIPTHTERDCLLLEQKLIHRFQPLYNTVWRDDKTYPYIQLTRKEDYPRIFLTRKRKKDGSLYFGPYPQVSSIRKLLRFLWRKKTLPLRPCRFDFRKEEVELGLEKSNPSLYKKVQSCIYLHTEECPAPCVQKISQKDYADIARKAADFFKGNIQSLKSEMEKEMKSAGEKLEFERAADLRDSLQSLQTVQEKVRIAEADETTVLAETELSRSLTELQEKLGLPYPPLRMEAFDISNIQGTEPVASMVVFELGKPLPSNYRKYKIKTVTGPNDFAMIAEVVRRRYRRLAEEGKKFPDLILIDGGKGQLSAALSALRNLKESGFQIPFLKFRVIALAKEFEEIYQENRKEPLRLPKDSPALRVLQWIRDEAHRFAVTFHRHRRENIF